MIEPLRNQSATSGPRAIVACPPTAIVWAGLILSAFLALEHLAYCSFGDEIERPVAVAVDPGGIVYIADRGTPAIWQIVDGKTSAYWKGTRQVGLPLQSLTCLAVDQEGALLAGDSATREIYRFDDQAQPQPLTSGRVGIPEDIAVHANGDIFAADSEAGRIVRIPAGGGMPTEFARVPSPRGLAFNPEGQLWAVSAGPDQVLRLSDAGDINVVIPGRPFRFPQAIAFMDKSPFVSDAYAKTIWKVGKSGEPDTWVAGQPLDYPSAMTSESGSLYIADPRAGQVFRITADKTVSEILSQPTSD